MSIQEILSGELFEDQGPRKRALGRHILCIIAQETLKSLQVKSHNFSRKSFPKNRLSKIYLYNYTLSSIISSFSILILFPILSSLILFLILISFLIFCNHDLPQSLHHFIFPCFLHSFISFFSFSFFNSFISFILSLYTIFCHFFILSFLFFFLLTSFISHLFLFYHVSFSNNKIILSVVVFFIEDGEFY